METLRFAPIIRVSTEDQERQGESLKVQKSQIEQAVKSINGTIPDYCWEYSGQEHATPGQERIKLEKLLSDSAKGLFDAVIVCDASRWSRDNLKSKEGLNILKANGIRFFIGTMESDLYNPAQNLFLGMSAEIGEFQAMEQARKSIMSRINRAKRNMPSAGMIPWGRIYDKKSGEWSTDHEKKKIIEQAAKRYIESKKDEGVPTIAKSVGVSPANLWRILTKWSGKEYPVTFKSERLNINETIVLHIPELLDRETIERIREKTRQNICYVRGNKKWFHLLQGFLYCKRCGYKFVSQHKVSGKHYYKHSEFNPDCGFKKWIIGTELENSVLLLLVQTLGDPIRLEEAIRKATPDIEGRKLLEVEQEILKREEQKLKLQKKNLIDAVADNLLRSDDIREKRNKIEESERSIIIRLNTISNELEHMPTADDIREATKWTGKVFSSMMRSNPKFVFKKSYEWKRKLIEKAFTRSNLDGSPSGVYLDRSEVDQSFTFEIRGLFDTITSSFPLSDDNLITIFGYDSEFEDYDEVLNQARSNISGKTSR